MEQSLVHNLLVSKGKLLSRENVGAREPESLGSTLHVSADMLYYGKMKQSWLRNCGLSCTSRFLCSLKLTKAQKFSHREQDSSNSGGLLMPCISLPSIIRAAGAKILSQMTFYIRSRRKKILPEEGQAYDRIRPSDLGC